MLPVTYMRLIARELHLDEVGQAKLLAGTSLRPADMTSMDQQVDEADQAIVLHNALAISGDPALGLRWGSHLHVTAHGPLGVLMSTSANLEAAWQAAARYYAVRERVVELVCEQRGHELVLRFRLHLPADVVGLFFLESVLVSVQRIAVLILGNAATREHVSVELGYPAPVYAERYADYLRCACHFGAVDTILRVPLALAQRPNPCADIMLYQQALTRCEELMQSRQDSSHWSERTIRLLRQNPGRLWTMIEVAQHFHLSPRTLIRHLKEEGTCYQDLLDDELGRLARLYLASRTYTVESVSEILGYQDVSSFRRAFKRWFGETPSDYVLNLPQS